MICVIKIISNPGRSYLGMSVVRHQLGICRQVGQRGCLQERHMVRELDSVLGLVLGNGLEQHVGNIHCPLGSWGHCIWGHRRQSRRSWQGQVLGNIGVDDMREHCMEQGLRCVRQRCHRLGIRDILMDRHQLGIWRLLVHLRTQWWREQQTVNLV